MCEGPLIPKGFSLKFLIWGASNFSPWGGSQIPLKPKLAKTTIELFQPALVQKRNGCQMG